MSDMTQRLQDSQKQIDYLRGEVGELMSTCEAEARDLSDDESIQLEEYATQIEAEEKRITNLERAEKAMAERVVERGAPAIIKQLNEFLERKPGEIIFKHATAALLAHVNKIPVDVAVKKSLPGRQGTARRYQVGYRTRCQ